MLIFTATHSEAITRYHASGMLLHIHSDAAFLSDTESKIRAGGYHDLSKKSADPNNNLLKHPPLNGLVHIKCTTMHKLLADAMEAETGA